MKTLLEYDGDRAEAAREAYDAVASHEGEDSDAMLIIENAMNAEAVRMLKKLTSLTDNAEKSAWRITLEYDNVHDGARVLDGDGNVIGECYDDGEPDDQFVRAIEKAIRESPNTTPGRDCELDELRPYGTD